MSLKDNESEFGTVYTSEDSEIYWLANEYDSVMYGVVKNKGVHYQTKS